MLLLKKITKMESSDIIFYAIIAISIIGSIVRAVNKTKPQNASAEQPASKGSFSGEIFRSILKEMEEKDDDFIPRNPEPKPATVLTPKPKPQAIYKAEVHHRPEADHSHDIFESATADFWKDGAYASTENKPRREDMVNGSRQQAPAKVEEPVYALINSLHLSSKDELKKAVIYSEILRPKF
jgi:hypothetical protein